MSILGPMPLPAIPPTKSSRGCPMCGLSVGRDGIGLTGPYGLRVRFHRKCFDRPLTDRYGDPNPVFVSYSPKAIDIVDPDPEAVREVLHGLAAETKRENARRSRNERLGRVLDDGGES